MPDKSYEAAAQDAASATHDIWADARGRVFCRCGRNFGEPLIYAQAIFAHGVTVGYELGARDASQLPAPPRRSLHADSRGRQQGVVLPMRHPLEPRS